MKHDGQRNEIETGKNKNNNGLSRSKHRRLSELNKIDCVDALNVLSEGDSNMFLIERK